MVKCYEKILGNLEYVVIIFPLLIGAFQIYSSKTDALSAWRGGGFGMYTEPHPVHYRVVFLINTNDSLNTEWIRVYPLDSRLENDTIYNARYRSRVKGLLEIVGRQISFPLWIDKADLKSQLRAMQLEWSGNPGNYYVPSDTLKMQVFEVHLTENANSLHKSTIFEILLCLKD